MDSRLSQQLATIRQAEALERAVAARTLRAVRRRRRLRLTLPHAGTMIGVWRAGSRAR
jgi:hypothetical protein